MNKSTLRKGLGVALILAAVVSLAIAAPDQQGQRGQRGQRGPAGQGGPGMGPGGRQFGGFDPAAMQERMLNMMKERMGASDEEWTVIEPRLSKVMELNQQIDTRGGMMRGMMRNRRNPGGQNRPDQNQNPEDQTAIQKASQELQDTLEKEAPSAAEIKAKLTALRGAREKAKQDLAKAQEQLKEVLTVKQEAQLVMMGLLD